MSYSYTITPAAIRRATRADVPALARIHRDTVVAAYAGYFPPEAPPPSLAALEREWRDELDGRRLASCAFLAEDGAGPFGTVAVRADPDLAGAGQLRRLHVLPDRWEAGAGTALHDAALEAMRVAGWTAARLWVLEANLRARRFYERRGWELVEGETLDWPGIGVTEVRYRRSVRP